MFQPDVTDKRSGKRYSAPTKENPAECWYGCGLHIYVDTSTRSKPRDGSPANGWRIPMEFETHHKHQCPRRPESPVFDPNFPINGYLNGYCKQSLSLTWQWKDHKIDKNGQMVEPEPDDPIDEPGEGPDPNTRGEPEEDE